MSTFLHYVHCKDALLDCSAPGGERCESLTWVDEIYLPLTLQWRHNECDGMSNHKSPDCLLERLFRCKSKKTSKLPVTGLCEGYSPVTGEFSAQRASNAEKFSIWWRHHGQDSNPRVSGTIFCSRLNDSMPHKPKALNPWSNKITSVGEPIPMWWANSHHFWQLGLCSLSGKTSYRKIAWSIEAARFGFRHIQSLWNLTGTSAAVLPRCLSNFRAIWWF